MSRSLGRVKQTRWQWLQNANQMNGATEKAGREISRIFAIKRENLKDEINVSVKHAVRTKISETCTEA
jgi:hypothetical protein